MSARIYENNATRLTYLLKDNLQISINKKDKSGNTLLHIAVMCDNEECVKLLVMHGIDLNKQNVFGDTSLHIAIRNYSNRIADYLVKCGAN